jgi:hypothetical protein
VGVTFSLDPLDASGHFLDGHGLKVIRAQGEDLDSLYGAMCEVINHDGPAAVADNLQAMSIKGPSNLIALQVFRGVSGNCDIVVIDGPIRIRTSSCWDLTGPSKKETTPRPRELPWPETFKPCPSRVRAIS